MPRVAKPYLERDWYVSRAGGEYIKLCQKSEGIATAKRVLKEHLKRREQEKEQSGGRVTARLTVAELFALFLESLKAEKSEAHYLLCQRWCIEFAKQHAKKQARDISRYDAQQFKQYLLQARWVRNNQPPRPYQPKSINHAVTSLRCAFNWGIDNELLPEGRNPFGRLRLLPCRGRKRVATQQEFESLIRHCSDDAFRDVLTAMRFTPARPGDIRALKWSMVNLDNRRLVISEHKTSKTARRPKPFVIGINGEVEQILRRRKQAAEQSGGYGPGQRVFLNRRGRPWTKDALGLRMRRLRKTAGIQPDANGEQFVLYTNRHTFITAAGMDASISDAVRVDMAGHTDGRTTQIYTHLPAEAAAEAGRRVADSLKPQSMPGK